MGTKIKATVLQRLEADVSRAMSMPIEEIRNTPLCQMQRLLSKDTKRGIVVRDYPEIGRGNVMTDRIRGSAEIDDMIDRILSE